MTLPNALSAARALLVIPVIGLIATGDASLALLVFLGAAATDALDGPLARRRGSATAFGAALDPLADKILVVGALAALEIRRLAPAWAVVLTAHGASSEFFQGGAVVYSNEAKTILADVAPNLIHGHGAVSSVVAGALARGARERLGAKIGLGITGIAGPGGATPGKKVGLT